MNGPKLKQFKSIRNYS